MADTVLCIAGSPRRNGNTDRLLAETMQGARDAGLQVEHLVVHRLRMNGCLACGACAREGRCVVPDDMQGVFASLDRADHLVIAMPVFFMGVPSKLKAVIDRCQLYWARRFVRQEPVGRERPGGSGALIAVGGSAHRNLFNGPCHVVKSVMAVMEFRYKDELLLTDLEGPDDVLKHPDALARAREIGLKIAQKNVKSD